MNIELSSWIIEFIFISETSSKSQCPWREHFICLALWVFLLSSLEYSYCQRLEERPWTILTRCSTPTTLSISTSSRISRTRRTFSISSRSTRQSTPNVYKTRRNKIISTKPRNLKIPKKWKVYHQPTQSTEAKKQSDKVSGLWQIKIFGLSWAEQYLNVKCQTIHLIVHYHRNET